MPRFLELAPEKRITPRQIKDELSSILIEFSELTMRTSINITQKFRNQLFFHYQAIDGDPAVDEFPGKSNNNENVTKTAECVKIMLDERNVIAEKMLQTMIMKAWRSPEKCVKFLAEVRRRVNRDKFNTIVAIKALMLMHSYVHRGPRALLTVPSKENPKLAYVEDILAGLGEAFTQPGHLLIRCYCELLSSKFQLLTRHTKLINNNLSLNRQTLHGDWQLLINFELLMDTFDHFSLALAFVLNFKRYFTNYFFKNILCFVAKEFVSALALLFNLALLLLFVNS